MKHILTCDETWVHYNPETKQLNMEWLLQNATAPTKTRLSAGKVLARDFLYYRGVANIDFHFDKRTTNAAHYCKLLDKVKATYWSKILVLIHSVLLLSLIHI